MRFISSPANKCVQLRVQTSAVLKPHQRRSRSACCRSLPRFGSDRRSSAALQLPQIPESLQTRRVARRSQRALIGQRGGCIRPVARRPSISNNDALASSSFNKSQLLWLHEKNKKIVRFYVSHIMEAYYCQFDCTRVVILMWDSHVKTVTIF